MEFSTPDCKRERSSGSLEHTPTDPSLLVERLQLLKSRLAKMTKTLEASVSSASPIKSSDSEDIVYTTPKLVQQLLESQMATDPSRFLGPSETPAEDEHVTEIRFTLATGSEEEAENLVKLLASSS
eukprot:753017-Hanusia_phi.AAC.4